MLISSSQATVREIPLSKTLELSVTQSIPDEDMYEYVRALMCIEAVLVLQPV